MLAGMAVPKTAVNKNCQLVLRKNNIGAPGQILTVEPETITPGVQQAPDILFWHGVCGLNPAHYFTSLLAREHVCHRQLSLSKSDGVACVDGG